MNEYGLIYMYTSPSNKRYVGQTIQFEKRQSQHETQAYNPNCASYDCAFHRAIRKYGIENFKLEVLEDNIPRIELDNKEKYWINEMKSFGEGGYNLTQGGCGNLGRIWTEEMRQNISQINKGKNLGHQVTEETRRKISKKNKGKSHPRSEETRKKISEHNARAVAKKITFANEGVYHDKEFYPGLTFESVQACANYFGVKLSTMSGIKAGKFNKTANMKIVEVAQ